MAIDVKVPSVGESITSGTIGAWRKTTGTFVNEGEVLFEIETDKVTSEVYADSSGILELLKAEGDEVQVGEVVARIDETAQPPAGSASTSPESAPQAATEANMTSSSSNGSNDSALALSPAVRHLIEENKLDPAVINGTGKDGRILKADVLAHLETAKSQPAPATPAQVTTQTTSISRPVINQQTADQPRTTRRRMTQLRRKIADRLVMAQSEAAMLTTFNEVDMTNILATRKKFQDRFVEKHNIKLGFMSFFVKAAIFGLKQVPAINAQIDGEEIVQNHYFDIGVAISTEKGLLVPVLRDCDAKSLAGLESDIIDYSKKARSGKITLNDLDGGVFTITNGGVFGSMLSTPILNPPQCAILGMHAIIEKPVAINGRVEIRPMMYLALSYDHRIVDGKEAVTFLVRIKEFIENPTLGLLDL
ncbi:MAG: 2-oxoglutarate dehydrogenase complex dihydrolipoyllysine-residue succinyltransferase [Verrucomicrobiota bacterium]